MKNTNLLPCKVVMIATEKTGNILKSNSDGEIMWSSIPTLPDVALTPQHLYFVSEQEIKEVEWVFNKNTQSIYRIVKRPIIEGEVKIIATTDPSLGLPLIGQPFVEAYVKAQGKIKEVNLELIKREDDSDMPNHGLRIISYPATRPDGTVIVHQSKTYTREEVERIVGLAFDAAKHEAITTTQFIEENL